jgi:predicted nucleic acid-binding protein
MFVLDASIAVKWFFDSELEHEAAINVLTAVTSTPDLFVAPELFLIELSAVLLKKTDYDSSSSLKATNLVSSLGIRLLPNLGESLQRSISLSEQLRLSLYDSIYLNLAIALNGKWITADKKAIAHLGKLKKHAMALTDFRH